MLEYGILEKYDKSVHGPRSKNKLDKFLKTKYLSFESKKQSESCNFFLKEVEHLPNRIVTLKKVYKYNNYTFGVDKSEIIVKIQKLWKSYLKKKYNVRYIMSRQIRI